MSTFKKFVRFGAKCPGAKCPWGILSWGILSLGQNVLGAKCPLADIFVLGKVWDLKGSQPKDVMQFTSRNKLPCKRNVVELKRQTVSRNSTICPNNSYIKWRTSRACEPE